MNESSTVEPAEFAFQWNGAGGLLFEQRLDGNDVLTHIHAAGVDFRLSTSALTQVREADGSDVLQGRNAKDFLLDEITGSGIHHAWGGGETLAYEQVQFNGDTWIYRQSAADALNLMVFNHDGSWLQLTLQGSRMHALLAGTDHVLQVVDMDTAIALVGVPAQP